MKERAKSAVVILIAGWFGKVYLWWDTHGWTALCWRFWSFLTFWLVLGHDTALRLVNLLGVLLVVEQIKSRGIHLLLRWHDRDEEVLLLLMGASM